MGHLKTPSYYKVEIARYPALSLENERDLFVDYRKRRTAKKRDAIVRQYLYWAAEIACRYCGPRMPKADAISAANYGLMLAIDKFDPAGGRRFVTYSYFSIRREVLNALTDSYVINPESGVWAAAYRFKQSAQSPEDLAKWKKDRRWIFNCAGAPRPCGGPAVVRADEPGEDFIGPDIREDIEQTSRLEAMKQAAQSLPPEMRAVIELKYFNDGNSLPLVAIGKKLKCSVDRVRSLHTQALKLLRKSLRRLQEEN